MCFYRCHIHLYYYIQVFHQCQVPYLSIPKNVSDHLIFINIKHRSKHTNTDSLCISCIGTLFVMGRLMHVSWL